MLDADPGAPRRLFFAYGTLMIPESANAVLGRVPAYEPASLRGYVRGWTATVRVAPRHDPTRVMAGRFLNIERSERPDALVHGLAFGVTDNEVNELLRREVGYELAHVGLRREDGSHADALTVVFPVQDDVLAHAVFLPECSSRIVRSIESRGADLLRAYLDTTAPCASRVLEGPYVFADAAVAARV